MDKKALEKALHARIKRKQTILREGGEQALSHSQEDIMRIKQALTRLKTSGFGCCISCGLPIPEKRLAVYLEAERCTPCQTEHENSSN